MTRQMAVERRVSRLGGGFEQFPARLDSLENGLWAEIKSLENGLWAEIKASENGLRAELKAAESRIILWLGGIMVAAVTLAVAAIKSLP